MVMHSWLWRRQAIGCGQLLVGRVARLGRVVGVYNLKLYSRGAGFRRRLHIEITVLDFALITLGSLGDDFRPHFAIPRSDNQTSKDLNSAS